MLTQTQVQQLLDYEPATGLFTWKERPGNKRFNTLWAGKPAFTQEDGHGYLCGSIFNKTYRASRIAWLYHRGVWPQHEIDHINHDKKDNRILNLRDVPHRENTLNRKSSKKRFIRWR